MTLGLGLRWAVPAAAAAAGVVLRDCLFLAAAGPLALGAFYLSMDARPPTNALRGAVRCALAGLASLAGGVVLAAAVVAALNGAWNPAHDRFHAGAWLLAASVGAYLVLSAGGMRQFAASVLRESALGLAVLLAVLVALPFAAGIAWSVCALPIATAALMVAAGWRLLREVSPAMFQLGQRR